MTTPGASDSREAVEYLERRHTDYGLYGRQPYSVHIRPFFSLLPDLPGDLEDTEEDSYIIEIASHRIFDYWVSHTRSYTRGDMCETCWMGEPGAEDSGWDSRAGCEEEGHVAFSMHGPWL